MKYYWNAYHATERELRERDGQSTLCDMYDLHKVRDGAAFAEFRSLLPASWRYGGIILNVPTKQSSGDTPKIKGPSYLSSQDVLIQTTRPPLQDEQSRGANCRGSRKVARSYSEVEDVVFEAMGPFFDNCDRQIICLSDEVVTVLTKKPSQGAKWCRWEFRATRGAVIEQRGATWNRNWETCDTKGPTCGFLVYAPSDGNRPDVVCSFGMGGLETLTFNHLLRTDRKLQPLVRRVLKRERSISAVQFSIPECPPVPLDLSFTRDANPRILFSVSLD